MRDVSERKMESAGRMQRVRRRVRPRERAVPALLPKLMLTLGKRHPRAFAGRHHRVRVALAQRPLTRRQVGYAAADDARAERDDRRPRVVQEKERVDVDKGGCDAMPTTLLVTKTDDAADCHPVARKLTQHQQSLNGFKGHAVDSHRHRQLYVNVYLPVEFAGYVYVSSST